MMVWELPDKEVTVKGTGDNPHEACRLGFGYPVVLSGASCAVFKQSFPCCFRCDF